MHRHGATLPTPLVIKRIHLTINRTLEYLHQNKSHCTIHEEGDYENDNETKRTRWRKPVIRWSGRNN